MRYCNKFVIFLDISKLSTSFIPVVLYFVFFLFSAYLIYMLERYVGNVWIGYHHEPYSEFKFVDMSLAAHTYWAYHQPNRQLSQRSCTQANVTGSKFGVWDDVACDITNPFICEIYKGMFKLKN